MTTSDSDDKLGRALRAAAGRDLPGGDFDDRVMRDVADGGGEREIAAAIPRRPIYWAGLAAAVLIGFFLGATFFRGGDAPEGGGDGISAAAAPRVALPFAENAVASPRPIVITITDDGKVWCGGEVRGFPELTRLLKKAADGSRDEPGAPEPSLRDVIIRCDVRVRWRVVQWTMQACADPSVRMPRIHWAVRGGSVLPVFLPMDRGLRGRFLGPAATGTRVELRRGANESVTRLEFNGTAMRLDQLDPAVPLSSVAIANFQPEVDASADVPFGDVVRVVDWLRRNGSAVTFTGAPPLPSPFLRETITPLKEEVKPEIEEQKPVEEDERIIEDPVIRDAKVSDHNEVR